MQIQVTVKTVREALIKLGKNQHQLGMSGFLPAKASAKKMVDVTLQDMSLESLTIFRDIMKENDEDEIRRVSKIINQLKDPTNKVIAELKDFPRVFKEYLKANGNPLLFSTNAELRGIAYLPLDAEVKYRQYHNRQKDDEYILITLAYNTQSKYKEYTIHLERRDMRSTVPAILRAHGLMVPDESMLEVYQKINTRFKEYSGMQGEQFKCRNKANVFSGRDEYWWNNSQIDFTRMGKPTSGVLDVETAYDKERISFKSETYSDVYDASIEIPIHPILPIFSLTHHKIAWVNVVNMAPYKYESDLTEKLVLPKSHVRLIHALVSNLDALRDEDEAENKSKTIKAKASSSIILCKGKAGTGKTLTAEVYANEIQRPLYEIQSGQIGTDPEEMEARLGIILERSIRLRMPLLINEADVFIKERGNDVVQNAIVSVFLRVLEYHNGLVFLTTNRANDIDDAILSRCIAEIQYEIPASPERLRLWRIMLNEFNVELPTKELRRVVQTFPEVVGRDIQNLIRLTNRVCKALEEPFSLEALKANAVFKSIKIVDVVEDAKE